jgi:ribosome-associated toxin RatA of RatAB toxin-antitoxin module
LSGTWNFDDLGEDGSKVRLLIEFEFASGLLGAALRQGFERLVDRLVDDFVQCAFDQPQHDVV